MITVIVVDACWTPAACGVATVEIGRRAPMEDAATADGREERRLTRREHG
jgi:hypothetical protein